MAEILCIGLTCTADEQKYGIATLQVADRHDVAVPHCCAGRQGPVHRCDVPAMAHMLAGRTRYAGQPSKLQPACHHAWLIEAHPQVPFCRPRCPDC